MSKSLDMLVDVLNEKGNALQLLKSILEEERRHIIELKSDELEEVSSRKEQAAAKIKILNERFRTALSGSFRELGLPEENNLSPLIKRLPEPERENLSVLQTRLISVSKKIEELLAVNKGLLENSIHFMERSMKFFKRLLSKSDIYSETGRMLDVPSEARLFCKEI